MTDRASDGKIISLTDGPETSGEDDIDQPTQVADLEGLARRVEFDHQKQSDEDPNDDPTLVGTVGAEGDAAADDDPTSVRDVPLKAQVLPPPAGLRPGEVTPVASPRRESGWGALLAPLMMGIGFGLVVLAYLILTR